MSGKATIHTQVFLIAKPGFFAINASLSIKGTFTQVSLRKASNPSLGNSYSEFACYEL